MDNLPPAAEMRKRINEAQTHAAAQQLSDLARQIRGATERGQSSLQVKDMSPGVEGALRQAGYKVKHWEGDQRDPAYYSVSW